MRELKLEAAKLLSEATGKQVDPNSFSPTPKPELGFFASNIAFQLDGNPAQNASELAIKIKSPVLAVKAVGPYLNFFPSEDYSKKLVTGILKDKENYGRGEKKKEKIMVEFSQPNTHKAFHVGHIRGTSLGFAMANILEHSGYDVIKATYDGDTGTHIAKCLWAMQKFHAGEKPPAQKGKWLAEIYREANSKLKENEEYEKEVREVFHKMFFEKDKDLLALWKETRQWSLDEFDEIYKEMGVSFDVEFFESEVEEEGTSIVKKMLDDGLAKIDDEAIIIDLDKLGVYLLLRRDGTPLYSTKDIALAKKKFEEYEIDKSIYITASEQKLHFQQLFKTLELMGFPQAKDCVHIPFELVMLPEGKMKTREGTVIFYEDFAAEAKKRALKEIEEKNPELKDKESVARAVGIGAIKYAMLRVSNNKTITFDWDKSLSFDGETAPYIQYANVRCHSILDKAKKKPKAGIVEATELIYQLSRLDDVIHESASGYSPHLLAAYTYSLADSFSKFYTKQPVIGSKDEEALLAVVEATSVVLELCLKLLGIEAPRQM